MKINLKSIFLLPEMSILYGCAIPKCACFAGTDGKHRYDRRGRSAMIEVKDVSLTLNKYQILKNVTISVNKGEAFNGLDRKMTAI